MVVMRRYGLDSRDNETLSAIGKRLALARERIRQIQGEAFRLLPDGRGSAYIGGC